MAIVINLHHGDVPKGAINIMRPHMFANPFVIGKDGTRDEVCDKHMVWLRARIAGNDWYRYKVKMLHGCVLKCCCKPLRCHGGNLAIVAAELNGV